MPEEKRHPGRPKTQNPREPISARLDPEVFSLLKKLTASLGGTRTDAIEAAISEAASERGLA